MKRLEEVMASIAPTDAVSEAEARRRLDCLTKPPGSLGRLEDLAARIAGMTRRLRPRLDRKVIAVLAGDHGIAARGVSAYPAEVTPQMVRNFVSGGAAINVLARHVGARIVVADLGVAADLSDLVAGGAIHDAKIAMGTADFTQGPAMTRAQAEAAVTAGMDLVREIHADGGLDILGTGDMGIGNTTPSAAMLAAFTGMDPAEVTGRGTGIDDPSWERKVALITDALARLQPDLGDPLGVLERVGGFEIGGLAGCVLQAAALRVPVVVDGFISSVGALLATRLCPAATDYLIPSHASVERGHRILLAEWGLDPLFDLRLRLGEGTGAALGISICEASCRILDEMATFEEAGVSES